MKALRLELTQVREDERQARIEAAEFVGRSGRRVRTDELEASTPTVVALLWHLSIIALEPQQAKSHERIAPGKRL